MIINAGDNILLELLDDKHAEQVFNLLDSNRAHLKQWLPWVDSMATLENFSGHIAESKQRFINGTDWPGVILLNNIVAGRIGIHYINAHNRIGAVGYWLGENFQGKGIITKACKAMIDYGFSTLNLNRIEIKCATGNIKSKAVPERLNFKKEGIIRQGESVNGQFIDLYIYSLLKEEWKANNK